MPPDPRPVFHDPSGRRRVWALRIAVALGACFLAVAAVFLISLVAVPSLPPAAGLSAPLRKALRPHLPPALPRENRVRRFLLSRARHRLLEAVALDQAQARRRAEHAPLAHRDSTSHPGRPVVAAFYATWQETGLHSLRAHADHLTHLMPLWLRIGADGRSLDTQDWAPESTPHNLDVLKIAREHRLNIMPVLSNAHGGSFDRDIGHRLLGSTASQRALAQEVAEWLTKHGFAGVNIDLENLSPADVARIPAFLKVLRESLAPRHLQLSFDLEVEGDTPNAAEVAAVCDFVVLMAYDQHAMNNTAGPLCGIDWYRAALDAALASIPGDKLVMGVGSYGYDWTEARAPAEALTFQEALFLAKDNHPDEAPETVVDFDSLSLNPTFHYDDENGRDHEVWLLDAVTVANQRVLAAAHGVQGSALWVLGAEDPAVWSMLDRRLAPDAPPEPDSIAQMSYPYDVEFQGDGELLSVASLPHVGERKLERDAATGLFTDEAFHLYPTSYLIRRQGFRDHCIALTFDDGPSGDFTPRILDALRELRAPATFFVIGENAERHPDLIRRMWDEGHEIGNHTYTHPNLAAIPARQVDLELNATQRVLQADLGHSSLLFRPPYNADAEPTSAEEVAPILAAAKLGYVTVGEYLDAQDWRLRTADGQVRSASGLAADIVARVHAGHGNAVLMHDGGGNRSTTLAALGIVVPQLRREGYRFVTVSALAGVSRESVMPPVSAADQALLGGDRVAFESLYLFEGFLHWAFLLGIVLGAARVLWVTVLALIARWRERRARQDSGPLPSVSVLIAAYREQPVIARTVAAVLVSTHAPLEVIVVDDGSSDGTAEEVETRFAQDPRVRVLRQANCGKAAALRRAIDASSGEVLVCLDADTLFAPETLARLARHLCDPRVGAVAGNVKVGNRVNVWTRWQALEYITSQNLDRRAYALLDAITVVPGAVGAWRRRAVVEAGGFLSDTLAEDMDLTWRVRRAGWRVANEPTALAYTEAPDSITTLYRQRFRWSFGTLQCLWKHRDALGRYGWFGRVGLPTLWVFQIAFPVLSPIIDLEIAWTLLRVLEGTLTRGLLTRDWQPLPNAVESLATVGFLYLFFFLLELLGSSVAIRLDRERPRLLLWLFWQRFVYRQVMYAVVWRALRTAIEGQLAGWGKLPRKNTAQVDRTRDHD